MDVAIAERDITDEDLALAGRQAQITMPCVTLPPICMR
jgi:hypothetical protein